MEKERKRTLHLAGLTITAHPHDTDIYEALLHKAYSIKGKAVIHGKNKGTIGQPVVEKRGKNTFVYFSIYKYYDLSKFGLWFRESTQEAVESTKENPLANIPDDLKPELTVIPAVLVMPGHHILFDSQGMGPTAAEKFFRRLLNEPPLLEQFGPIDVTMIQDINQLERILRMEKLTKLTILIKRPNADDEDADEERIARRMENMGVHRWEQELGGRPYRQDGITPDEELRPYMNVALENGEVKAEGYERDEKVSLSTRTAPRKRRIKVPKQMGMADFINAVADIWTDWRRK